MAFVGGSGHKLAKLPLDLQHGVETGQKRVVGELKLWEMMG
jgi:hypothetical protein